MLFIFLLVCADEKNVRDRTDCFDEKYFDFFFSFKSSIQVSILLTQQSSFFSREEKRLNGLYIHPIQGKDLMNVCSFLGNFSSHHEGFTNSKQ